MILNIDDYNKVIDDYYKFIIWYRYDFLKKFEKDLKALTKHIYDYIRPLYKEKMVRLNRLTIRSLAKRAKKILEIIQDLKKKPEPNKIRNIIKEANELPKTLHFWEMKANEFFNLVMKQFGELDPSLSKFLQEFRREPAKFNGKTIRDTEEEFLHQIQISESFDTTPTGRLILAKQFLQLSQNEKLRQKIGSYKEWFKKYSIEERWQPNLNIQNQYGSFKLKHIYFHLYFHQEYRKNIIKKLFNKQLIKGIENEYFRGIFESREKVLDKRAKFQALFETFNQNPNEFIELLLKFELYALKLAYLKYPDRLIRSPVIDINLAIRDIGEYGGAHSDLSTASEIFLIESIFKLLGNFTKLCISVGEDKRLFDYKEGYQIGKFPNNVPRMFNWDYDLNRPLLLLKFRELANILNDLFAVKDEFPYVRYEGIPNAILVWIHELTHNYDRDKNPNPIQELNVLYKLPVTERTASLVHFMTDLRSDALTQWRDSNIFHKGKHIEPVANKMVFATVPYLNSINQAKDKINRLVNAKEHSIVGYMGRAFPFEYYAIGKFYTILYGIMRYIRQGGKYLVFTGKERRLSKVLEDMYKEVYNGYDLNELAEKRFDDAVRSRSKDEYLKIRDRYPKLRKDYVKDVEFYEKTKGPLIILPNYEEYTRYKKTNPELAMILERAENVAFYYLWNIGLIYWEKFNYPEGSPEYNELEEKYDQYKKKILKKQWLLNMYTRSIEFYHKTQESGQMILMHTLLDRDKAERLVRQGAMQAIEITHDNRKIIGKLIDKKVLYFASFNSSIVEEVFDHIHNIGNSLDFFRMIKDMDDYFGIPLSLRLFKDEKDLFNSLRKAAMLDLESMASKGFDISEKEVKEFLSNL